MKITADQKKLIAKGMCDLEKFGKLTSKEKYRVLACFLVLPWVFILWPSPILVLLFILLVVALLYLGRRRDRTQASDANNLP